MLEGEIINIEKTNQNKNATPGVPKKKSARRPLIAMVIILVVIAGMVIINLRGNKNGEDTKADFPVSLEQIKNDFDNQTKKLKSDAIPPESYVERFKAPMEVSHQAIESGTPSQPDFTDLSEDYLNIASIHSILGDYEQAEEWYLKTLEKWPENYKANLNLADLYILMGQLESAGVKFYETATLFPQDSRVYTKMADFYYKYSTAEDKIAKAEAIYEWGIKKAEDPKIIFSEYSFFLENYVKDYGKALEMERNYQLTSGEVDQEEIERLQGLIEAKK